jgi:GNAT superfamily N-acetyltransferase
MLCGMEGPRITVCPASKRAAAIRALYAAGVESQQESLTHAVASMAGAVEESWGGLLVAEETIPLAAVWVQPTPGNTAVVWPPPPNCVATEALMRGAAALVDERRIALAQLIVGADDVFSEQMLAQCGFSRLAELVYMFAETAPAGDAPGNASDTHFAPRAGDEPVRLAALVEHTYVGTQDCPRLDGVRRIDDVLAGYRAQGRHLPNHWYLVESLDHNGASNGEDVGVLILAEHPGTESWELVYMGVIPQARGRRLGEKIVSFALQTAAQGGAARMVLAVDAANEPAREMYRRSGFFEWDRRIVYARLRA